MKTDSIHLNSLQRDSRPKLRPSYSIIKLMLRKNQQIASSAVLSQSENRSATSSEFRRSKKKVPYKIEICNQNLQEAIKEVKSSVRDNPEWKLNVKAVVSQYPPNKDKQSFINESQRIDVTQQQLPISNKLPFPKTTENNTFETLKFTERKRKEFEAKLQEIKERRMQLEVSLLEKQMRAKLQRKIQQNLKLKEKRQILRDIEQHREQSIRIREVEQNRKRMESSLLHQSNVASAKMIRKHRSRSHRQFIMDQKSKSDESALSLHFKQIQINKEKLEHRQIILSRYKSLRCASQGTLRRKSIQTSQSTRKE